MCPYCGVSDRLRVLRATSRLFGSEAGVVLVCTACEKQSQPFTISNRVFQIVRYVLLGVFASSFPVLIVAITRRDGLSLSADVSTELAPVVVMVIVSMLGVALSARGIYRSVRAGSIVALSRRDRLRR